MIVKVPISESGTATLGIIAVRGLRYADCFAQDAASWRIAHRVHTPLWQYNATPVTPFTASAKRRDG